MSCVYICFAMWITVALVSASCPHMDATLKRWSAAATWASGVPSVGADVVIGSGMRVLLDMDVDLGELVVEQGGVLVWDDANPQVLRKLRAKHVIVRSDGEFRVGSEQCGLKSNAHIVLYGGITDDVPNFGYKFLGVDVGGTLELHGEQRTEWTQLTKTVGNVGSFYITPFGRSLHVLVVDETTGKSLSTNKFDIYGEASDNDALVAFLAGLPAGRIVMCGVQDAAFGNEFTAAAQTALETHLFATKVATAKANGLRSSYALVATIGGSLLVEDTKAPGTGSVTVKGVTTVLGVSVEFEVFSAGYDDGNDVSFRATDVSAETIVELADDVVNWRADDQIVVAPTDFAYLQSERKTMLPCPTCTSKQVKVSGGFAFHHYGEIYKGVDMRAEVGLLTRSILIEGEMGTVCTGTAVQCQYYPGDTDGVHVKILNNFKNVHIAHVHVTKGGQMSSLGRYPIHFHLCGDVDAPRYAKPTYVKGVVVTDSFARAVTVHGTNGLLVERVVAHKCRGHNFFLEDGIEERNRFVGNLAISAMYGFLLPSDRSKVVCEAVAPTNFNGAQTNGDVECTGVSAYWITNPNNVFIDNHCAGSVNFCFWYIFPLHPMALSEAGNEDIFVRKIPLAEQTNNVAHSCNDNGFFLDDTIQQYPPKASSPQQQYSVLHAGRYQPQSNGIPTTSLFDGITVYKTRFRAVWMRGGNILIKNAFLSDNYLGMTLASEGTWPNVPGAGINYSTTLQRTTPSTEKNPIRGFEVYDGPIACIRCHFHDFVIGGVERQSSAIGWLLNNNWQNAPYNFGEAMLFDNVDVRLERGDVNGPAGNYFGQNDDKKICNFCWGLMMVAVKILDHHLREHFGFNEILYVYSGRRGLHCWVSDKRARKLSVSERAAVVEFLTLLKSAKDPHRKVVLRKNLPEGVKEANRILAPYFAEFYLEQQKILLKPERYKPLLALIPNEDIRAKLSNMWDNDDEGRHDTQRRWQDLKDLVAGDKDIQKRQPHLITEIVFSYVYPRLDANVTRGMNHLLKSPFVVHPGTGRVCVPIDPKKIDEFDPTEAPLARDVLAELDTRDDVADEENAAWKNTSMQEGIRVFTEFLRRLQKTTMIEKNKERNNNNELF